MFLQHTNFLLLCRNNRGSTRLLGRLHQIIPAKIKHSFFTICVTKIPAQMRLDTNLSARTHRMITMVWKAFCLERSGRSRAGSPGPGRIKTRRAERLQNNVISSEITTSKKSRMKATLLFTYTPILRKQSSQTKLMQTFLILVPLLFLRLL